ncbi:type IV secretory system conjugative DNA transfer family protein [Bacillus velezensis]
MNRPERIESFLGNKKVLTALLLPYALVFSLITNVLVKVVLIVYDVLKHVFLEQKLINIDYSIKIDDFFAFTWGKNQIIYLIFYAVWLYGYLVFSIKMYRTFGSLYKQNHGNTRFATFKELKEQYKLIPERRASFSGKGGIPISHINRAVNQPYKFLKKQRGIEPKNKIHAWFQKTILVSLLRIVPYFCEKTFIDTSPVNNLIIGTTRSGKGETTVFPSIDIFSRSEYKPTMIANDPKGELAAASKQTLEKRGYEVHILNLVDPNISMSYNPLQLVVDAYKKGDTESAVSLANTLSFTLYYDPNAKDKFWQNCSMSLCNALVLAITDDCIKKKREDKITLYTVANFLSTMGSKNDYDEETGIETNALDEYFQSRPETDPARMQYSTSNFSTGNTRGNIFTNTMSELQIFLNPSIAKMTSKNSLDLKKVAEGVKPAALFMVTPDYDSSLHKIASIFTRQSYYIFAKEASFMPNGKLKRNVEYILDEFGNMPAIEDMAGAITVCLGRNIRFNLYIQSYSQIKKLYGDDDETIIGNCGNQIYILTGDPSTAEKFSKLIGRKEVIDYSRSGDQFSFKKSETESVRERSLMLPEELTSIKPNETVVFRITKREDNNGRGIVSHPIFNTGKTAMNPRWIYLDKEFDTSNSIKNVEVNSLHKHVVLEELKYDHIGVNDKLSLAKDELSKETLENIKSQLLKGATANKADESYLQFIDAKFIEFSIYQLATTLKNAAELGYVSEQNFANFFKKYLKKFFSEKESNILTALNEVQNSNQSYITPPENDQDSEREKALEKMRKLLQPT